MDDHFVFDYQTTQCLIIADTEDCESIQRVLHIKSYFPDSDDPDNYTFDDAWNHKYHNIQWRQAIADELNSMRQNAVWNVVELPKSATTIGSRWVFKHKLAEDGSIKRFKARLVAKGYTQRKGIDFNETFAPVAKLPTLRLLFTLAGNNRQEIHQLDAKTAFLCAEIDEKDIYIKPPPGIRFGGIRYRNPALHLLKGIYGLKQSPRLWYARLTKYIRSIGFVMSEYDNCLWFNTTTKVMVAIYVDDLLVTGPQDEINIFKDQMKKEFEMVDSGQVEYFLGIQVRRGGGDGAYIWCQEHYIDKLLKQWDMEEAHEVSVPMQRGLYLSKRKPEEPACDKTDYQSAVGSLMYVMMATRPDIAYAVAHLSKFCNDPSITHWNALKRVLRYLKGTKTLGISLGGRCSAPEGLVGYTDADWASDSDDRKSVGAYCFMLNHSPISWTAKKQAFVATSTMESEYAAASQAAREGIWLRAFLGELSQCCTIPGFNKENPVRILCDNQAAIRVAKNPEFHKKAKHIDISIHFLRQRVQLGQIQMDYISTAHMVADFLTKPLAPERFIGCRDGMNIIRSR